MLSSDFLKPIDPSTYATDYKNFYDVMDYLQYSWEAFEVTTEDDYILTLFHVTGNKQGDYKPTEPPILMMHGAYQDAASWISSSAGSDWGSTPYQLQLADAGYDIWLGNYRGTWYSMKHNKYDAYEDKEYWDFITKDMALNDYKQLTEAVRQSTGYEKIFYSGYSMSTSNILYGMSHDTDYYASALYKVVNLAQCF